ncbi:MFS transporter [Streptomyces sp. SL13]|uniref:MFS transporter n=1 Tax=Streptantibioticus silvisoli TaxID=2705255 RepID=A0AA90KCA4_9ACTN|nr:MFS transporter [Streptantibioticus silvisoli]MDI5967033.1 MFS transporter [Streptantibioticus silvisoli]MDI5974232.1 MFS transporter [Streptantibioticus silvisoli]
MSTLEPDPRAAFLPRSPLTALLRHPVVAAVLLAGVLHLLWALFLATDGGDLAAQYAWTEFADRNPDAAYNLSWYGGMHPVSYSVLTPYVMAALGVRTTAVLVGTASAGLFARMLVRSGIERPMTPALWGAFALWCDSASGRVTFAVGMFFALAAAWLSYEDFGGRVLRASGAAILGALATMSSPVAGLFVEVVAVALFFTGRRKDAVSMAAGPVLVVGATTVFFPFYGVQPFSVGGALLPIAVSVPLVLWAPKSWRPVRIAAAAYSLGVVLTLAVPSPVGSNVERLALLFGGALLLAAVGAGRLGRRRTAALYLAFAVAAAWQVFKPVQDLVSTAPAAGWSSYAQPLVGELGKLDADRGRVEVVSAQTHWEAAGLSPYVNLARGWNRQVDVERNPLFYQGTLTPAAYHDWLRRWAVGYVVLPKAVPDNAAVAEAALVSKGQPWLAPIWHDTHWRVYRVTDPLPMAAAPSTVLKAGASVLSVRVPKAGPVLVRVTWSPWLDVLSGGQGCLEQDGEWTLLRADGPGVFHIGARYRLPRGTPCAAKPVKAEQPAPPANPLPSRTPASAHPTPSTSSQD